MRTKTFWLEGQDEPYRPSTTPGVPPPTVATATATTTTTTGGAGAGSYTTTYTTPYTTRAWTPYVSRFENANTPATFYVMIDPRAIQEGDRVVIVGNLAEMVRLLFCKVHTCVYATLLLTLILRLWGTDCLGRRH